MTSKERRKLKRQNFSRLIDSLAKPVKNVDRALTSMYDVSGRCDKQVDEILHYPVMKSGSTLLTANAKQKIHRMRYR